MNTFTKTFLTSLALTLGACDPAELDGFGDGATEFRPGGYGGYQLNTSLFGTFEHSEFDLAGKLHKFSRLTKVCLDPVAVGNNLKPEYLCIIPGVEGNSLSVKDGQIFGAKWGTKFGGTQFRNSRWSLEFDVDRDGSLESKLEIRITEAAINATPHGEKYFDYTWVFDKNSATNLMALKVGLGEGGNKYGEKNAPPELVPVCEKDVDTGSIASVVLGDTTIDTEVITGIVEKAESSMFIACHSGAAGKAPTWGYVLHAVGHLGYENVIRVIRADHCNNGGSFTEPGQKLAVTDSASYSKQYDSAYKLEGLASFEKGWLCVLNPRFADLSDITSACEIKICDESAGLGDIDSNIITQLVP